MKKQKQFWTDARNFRLWEIAGAAGYSYAELARSWHVKATRVRQHARRMGLVKVRNPKPQ